jgi:hypothetical protein
MPLDPTHFRLKLLHACDQWHSSRKVTLLPVDTVNCVATLKAIPIALLEYYGHIGPVEGVFQKQTSPAIKPYLYIAFVVLPTSLGIMAFFFKARFPLKSNKQNDLITEGISKHSARFRQKFTLGDAIGSHAIPFGGALSLPVGTVICVQTLKAHVSLAGCVSDFRLAVLCSPNDPKSTRRCLLNGQLDGSASYPRHYEIT